MTIFRGLVSFPLCLVVIGMDVEQPICRQGRMLPLTSRRFLLVDSMGSFTHLLALPSRPSLPSHPSNSSRRSSIIKRIDCDRLIAFRDDGSAWRSSQRENEEAFVYLSLRNIHSRLLELSALSMPVRVRVQ
jgi:hypothetical protein